MKNTLMIVLCSAAILASGCATTHRPDSLTLQGIWSGQEVVANTPGSSSLIIKGTDLEFHGADANDWIKGTFSLREDTTPKQLEGVVTDCASAEYVGKTVHAIYKIEGGKLTLTGNEPGNSAVPASFDAQGARMFEFTKKH
jgi:uncharacterized protein (TIGR03067 family)